LIGRLTRDPELRYLQNGTAVATFTLAVNRKYNKEETDFIDIVAWRQLAEHCANYLSKGRLVAVEGRLQIRSYEDKEGQKRKVTEIVLMMFVFWRNQGLALQEVRPHLVPMMIGKHLDVK
jgi:single-strand DNA-binding protein